MRPTTIFDYNLLAQLPGYVFIKNTDLIYTAASRYTSRLCGFKDPDDFSGHNDFELRCDAVASAVQFRAEDQKVLQLKKEISSLQVHQFADNEVHIFLLRKAPLMNNEGDVTGISCVGNEMLDSMLGKAIYKLLALGKPIFTKDDFKNITFEINANEYFNRLSIRESELIFYLIRGFNNKEIAAFMQLSSRTIESYLETIKNKFNCHSRKELLLYCMQNGFTHLLPASFLKKIMNKTISW